MMRLFSLLFSSFLLSILFLQPIQAEQFTVVLSDRTIKHILALHGLHFDHAWKQIIDDHNKIDENKLTALSQQITDIFNKITIQPILTNILFDEQSLRTFIQNITHQNEQQINEEQFDGHSDNISLFNNQLINNCVLIFVEKAQLLENQLSNFFIAVGKAICTYLQNHAVKRRLQSNATAAKDHLHLFIRVTLDTDQNKVHLATAQITSQEGFIKTYTDEEVREWLAHHLDDPEDSSQDQALIDSCSLRPEKESTCHFLTRYLGFSLVTIGVISLLIPDALVAPLNLENLSAISEYFGC